MKLSKKKFTYQWQILSVEVMPMPSRITSTTLRPSASWRRKICWYRKQKAQDSVSPAKKWSEAIHQGPFSKNHRCRYEFQTQKINKHITEDVNHLLKKQFQEMDDYMGKKVHQVLAKKLKLLFIDKISYYKTYQSLTCKTTTLFCIGKVVCL